MGTSASGASTSGSSGSSGSTGATSTKVLILMGEDLTMCASDPPGSGLPAVSACQTFSSPLQSLDAGPNFCEPDGQPHPLRSCALYGLLSAAESQPNLELALEPFSTLIAAREEYPPSGNSAFLGVTSSILGEWLTVANQLPVGLTPGEGIQGVLGDAIARISTDAASLTTGQASGTRYQVVLVASGPPTPFCTLPPDAGPFATASMPDGTWPDSTNDVCGNPQQEGGGDAGSGPPGYCLCELSSTNPLAPTLTADGGYNQPRTLYAEADQLAALKTTYGLASVELDTVFLWDSANYNSMTPAQQAQFLGYFSVSDAESVTSHILTTLAQHGGGTFQEVNPPAAFSFKGIGGLP